MTRGRPGTSTGRLMLAVLGGKAGAAPRPVGSIWAAPPAQQKEATRRRAQGATLEELAESYDRSVSNMCRVTRAA
jgi:hypothetical protein